MIKVKLLPILALSMVLSSASYSKATELTSIGSYLSKNDLGDPAVVAYLSLRCAALTGYVQTIMPPSTPVAKLNQMEEQFNLFMMLSAQSSMSMTGDDMETVFGRLEGALKATLDKQVKISNDHYVSTGSYLREIDFQDFELCSNLAVALSE